MTVVSRVPLCRKKIRTRRHAQILLHIREPLKTGSVLWTLTNTTSLVNDPPVRLTMYIVVFLNFEFHKNKPKCAQSIVKRICDEGHSITMFASTPKGRLFPVLEEPRSQFTTSLRKKPAELVQDRISKADAVLLLTDKPVYEIPNNLQSVKERCNGRVYLWRSYGVCCALLGGTVSNKQVAMQLRALLEDSNNLMVGRVLPRPCNFEKMYSVDPMCETGEPCVT